MLVRKWFLVGGLEYRWEGIQDSKYHIRDFCMEPVDPVLFEVQAPTTGVWWQHSLRQSQGVILEFGFGPTLATPGHKKRFVYSFRFEGALVSAWGHNFDHIHHNVLSLGITRTAFQEHISNALNRLPQFLKRIARFLMPAYFLPARVVMKTLKPGWQEEFDNESAMYERLKPLQGQRIPEFLGHATHEGSPAIILSHIEGVPSHKQESGCRMAVEQFEKLVEEALWELTKYGVAYDDTKLDNFLISDGKVKIVDLETVFEVEPPDYELAVTSYLDHLVTQYRRYLNGHFADFGPS
ncbi:hypothetical protein MY11210_004784 [Beauveria gryllotalpidicola]